MNTPRSKPSIRFGQLVKSKTRPKGPDGTYVGTLSNGEMLKLLGQIVVYLPQIEERIIDVMALLMGDRGSPARQVFRALNSEDARVKVMRSLLEHSRLNREKGPEFDEIIDLFVEVKKMRNAYVHGLWETHTSGRAFLREPSGDESFLSEREVKAGEMKATLARMAELWKKCLAVTYPHVFGPRDKPPASPETPS